MGGGVSDAINVSLKPGWQTAGLAPAKLTPAIFSRRISIIRQRHWRLEAKRHHQRKTFLTERKSYSRAHAVVYWRGRQKNPCKARESSYLLPCPNRTCLWSCVDWRGSGQEAG